MSSFKDPFHTREQQKKFRMHSHKNSNLNNIDFVLRGKKKLKNTKRFYHLSIPYLPYQAEPFNLPSVL